jgi:hypothetical protein
VSTYLCGLHRRPSNEVSYAKYSCSELRTVSILLTAACSFVLQIANADTLPLTSALLLVASGILESLREPTRTLREPTAAYITAVETLIFPDADGFHAVVRTCATCRLALTRQSRCKHTHTTRRQSKQLVLARELTSQKLQRQHMTRTICKLVKSKYTASSPSKLHMPKIWPITRCFIVTLTCCATVMFFVSGSPYAFTYLARSYSHMCIAAKWSSNRYQMYIS